MSPNDKELYCKGHIEVPNLLGGNGDCEGEKEGYYQDGFSTLSPPANQPASGPVVGEIIEPEGMPSGAVVPTEEGVVVGDGISISAPNE